MSTRTRFEKQAKGMKEMLYEVRYLKSSEDMILALTGQFMQLIKLSSQCEDHIFTWGQR